MEVWGHHVGEVVGLLPDKFIDRTCVLLTKLLQVFVQVSNGDLSRVEYVKAKLELNNFWKDVKKGNALTDDEEVMHLLFQDVVSSLEIHASYFNLWKDNETHASDFQLKRAPTFTPAIVSSENDAQGTMSTSPAYQTLLVSKLEKP